MKLLLTHPKEMRDLKFGVDAFTALAQLGTIATNETDEPYTLDELVSAANGCDVIVADRLTPGHARLFESCPNLIAFVRNAVDIRNIDVAAASRNGVLVTHAGPHFVDSVVELVVAQMIDLARDISGYAATYRSGTIPSATMGTQLAGKTAGIIGFGRIGQRLAEVLHVLRLRLLVADPYAKFDGSPVEATTLDDLLARSDYVICAAAHTPETDRLVDSGFLRKMKPSAHFLNLSRGAVVDEVALAEALDLQRIAGAALDVGNLTDDLPPVELGARPNVVATPHIGGLVAENILGQANDSVDQVRDIVHGRVPSFALNAADATRWRATVS